MAANSRKVPLEIFFNPTILSDDNLFSGGLPPVTKACLPRTSTVRGLPAGRGGGEGFKVEENDEKNDFLGLGIHPYSSSNPDDPGMPGRGGDRAGGEG
jgi:hypothetical protein